MNIQTRIEEKSWDYDVPDHRNCFGCCQSRHEHEAAYVSGAHFGIQLCIEMLRSEEAPYFSEGDFNLECAAWLEKMKGQKGV